MFDDNEDDFCFVYYECVCEKGGLNNHDDKEMEFCLFVCLYWWELSRLCLIIVVIVCVWEWVIFFCNCSSIGEMTSRLTPERPKRERASSTKSQTDVEEGFVCLLLFAVLLFFVRHFCFSLFWFVSCEPEISPWFSYSLLFYFLFSLEKTAFGFLFVLFCFLPPSPTLPINI